MPFLHSFGLEYVFGRRLTGDILRQDAHLRDLLDVVDL